MLQIPKMLILPVPLPLMQHLLHLFRDQMKNALQKLLENMFLVAPRHTACMQFTVILLGNVCDAHWNGWLLTTTVVLFALQ